MHKNRSRITKLIKSSVFENEIGEIEVNSLILFGFLNCQGSLEKKNRILYDVLEFKKDRTENDYKTSDLSASDKDLLPTIRKLVSLCTYELATLMEEVDGI